MGIARRARAPRAAGSVALTVLGAAALLGAGCGGNSSTVSRAGTTPSQTQTATAPTATTPSKTTRTTPAAKHRARRHARPAPTPPPAGHGHGHGKAKKLAPAAHDYLTAAAARDQRELFVATIAGTRTSNSGVRALTRAIVKERGREVALLGQDAAARHVRLPAHPIDRATTEVVRRLIPLGGSRLDAAYLRWEEPNVRAAIALGTRAEAAASGRFGRQLAGFLRSYRSELATIRALRASGA